MPLGLKDLVTQSSPHGLAAQGPFPPPLPFGMRQDGTPKGLGFFGLVPSQPFPQMSTEISFDFDQDGKNIHAPLMVPGLTFKELQLLLSNQQPTESILQKAIDHANRRIKEGKSPFAEEGEPLFPLPDQ